MLRLCILKHVAGTQLRPQLAQLSRRSIALAAPQLLRTRGGSSPGFWKQAAIAGGATTVGAICLNAVFNRDTRGSLSPVERTHLNKTFTAMATGLGIVAVTAVGLHRTGLSYRIALRMQSSPWLTMGASLVGCVGTMMLVHATPPENTAGKYLAFAAFNGAQAVLLSPLLFFAPAILGRAGLYTAGLVGSLSYVGATAREDKFLYIGGPLMAGLVLVALSSLAPMILPASASYALPAAMNISLYGGLAIFGGFTLYDTQKVLAHARQADQLGITDRLDPVAEAISLQLDFINIFIRLVSILASGGGGRRK